MNPNWRSFLESAEASFDGTANEVLHFGDAQAELQAATTQTILVPLTHLAGVEANGEDAKSFLHSQFTSDINHLAAGQVQHAAWCSAKGRMQASFLVSRSEEGFSLILAADLREAIQKRLQMFVLRAKVKLAAADEQVLLGLAGPQAAEALADASLPVPTESLTVANNENGRVICLDQQRYLLQLSLTNVAGLWQKLSSKARPAGVPAWRWLDVCAGFPLVTLATKEEFVPQMADFEKIGGVSFHKGCYPGQEIVARTQYLGKVKRHLFRVSCAAELKAGDVLHSPGNPDQSVGMIMSAAAAPEGGFAGLAVIQSSHADDVHLGALDGPLLQAAAVNP